MISDMEFYITPAYAIEHDIDEMCAYVIVSSSDRYDVLEERTNVLVLHFTDTEDWKRFDAINEKDAEDIVDFLETSEFPDAYICCDEGVSRSSAICAGLLKCTGRDDSYIWKSRDYRPNVLVYRTMLRHFFRHNEESEELRDIAKRSPEEYRYFRKNGRDLDATGSYAERY